MSMGKTSRYFTTATLITLVIKGMNFNNLGLLDYVLFIVAAAWAVTALLDAFSRKGRNR